MTEQAMISNEAGQVAMKYGRKNRVLVTCGPVEDRRQYVFDMRANICMAWINAEDVPCAQAVRGGCCGQRKPGVITLANEDDVRRWTNGGGR